MQKPSFMEAAERCQIASRQVRSRVAKRLCWRNGQHDFVFDLNHLLQTRRRTKKNALTFRSGRFTMFF